MKKISNFASKFGAVVLPLMLPIAALAAPATPQPAGTGSNAASNVPTTGLTSTQKVLDFLCNIYAWLFYFLIALTVIFIVVAAFRYLTSSGDPEKVKGATNMLLYAAIAIAVALLAWSIPQIVGDFLGASAGGTLATC